MIISASRRTDIPACYSEWFFNRLRERYVLVPNPFNSKQISRISLDPAVVDCLVLWTKNPAPMLGRLDELEAWNYYFQFTLNAYGPQIESRLPPLDERIETLRRLAERIGPERVIWRYDPVFVNECYPVAFHEEAFERIASALRGCTTRCMLGFLDPYAHLRRTMQALHLAPPDPAEIEQVAGSCKLAADRYAIRLETCTSKTDLRRLGIPPGRCIDGELVERLTGCPLAARKDPGQRAVCNCIESIDIGTYSTCLNGCAYCYANRGDHRTALTNRRRHDPRSPLLIGTLSDLPADAVIRDRRMRSLKDPQRGLL